MPPEGGYTDPVRWLLGIVSTEKIKKEKNNFKKSLDKKML